MKALDRAVSQSARPHQQRGISRYGHRLCCSILCIRAGLLKHFLAGTLYEVLTFPGTLCDLLTLPVTLYDLLTFPPRFGPADDVRQDEKRKMEMAALARANAMGPLNTAPQSHTI